VRFTDIEADTMASAKKMSLDDFYVKFTRLKGRGNKKYYELIETKSPFGMDCVFLDREAIPGKAICSLYSARPQQCKTWPFWPEIIEDKKSWNDAKSGCPGIGKGTVYPYEFIIDELNKS
jgi:Fe-S-cluster containining protein